MDTLDPRQAAFAGVLLLANRMQTHFDGQLDHLTLKQWLALVVIARLPQPVASTAQVTAVLGTSHQNVTKLLAALSDKGFIELTPSPVDRRARQVTLTETAHQYFADHEGLGDRLLGELFTDVDPDDLEACLRVLAGMSAALTAAPLFPPE